MRFTLPVPPTANNLFPTGRSGRRFPSKQYTAWKKYADLLWIKQGLSAKEFPITGRIRAHYVFHFADKRRRDIANFEKAITDFIVDHGAIEDDSTIDVLVLQRGSFTKDESFAEITLETI